MTVKRLLPLMALLSTLATGCHKEQDPYFYIVDEMYYMNWGTDALLEIKQNDPSDAATFKSSDTEVLTISKTGVMTAHLTGIAKVRATSGNGKFTDSCLVSVVGSSEIFHEPCTDFGTSVTKVKIYENRPLLQEALPYIVYDDRWEDVLSVVYEFDTNNQLLTATVKLKNSKTIYTNVHNQLRQRYNWTGLKNSVYQFQRGDVSIEFGPLNTSTLYVTYSQTSVATAPMPPSSNTVDGIR